MATPYIPPPDGVIKVLFQDEFMLLVDKPAGLLSVPGRGSDKQDCLLSRVRREYPEVLTVHRLDMSTSGLMVLARSKVMERELSILFQQRKVHKQYIAVVEGCPQLAEGLIDLPLITDWPNRPRQKVDHDIGKPSQTYYRLLTGEALLDSSRLLLEPVTGRSHQLRVHLMSLGHAILGDELYASPDVQARSERLLLHAYSLSFTHPITTEWVEVVCPLPF